MTYWDALADLATGADVGIMWHGNEHNILYFFETETPFDFLSAHVRMMKPSAQIMSKAAIRHSFQQLSFDELDLVVDRLATGGLNRIALIGTPPPKGDNEALRALFRLKMVRPKSGAAWAVSGDDSDHRSLCAIKALVFAAGHAGRRSPHSGADVHSRSQGSSGCRRLPEA